VDFEQDNSNKALDVQIPNPMKLKAFQHKLGSGNVFFQIPLDCSGFLPDDTSLNLDFWLKSSRIVTMKVVLVVLWVFLSTLFGADALGRFTRSP